MSGAKFCIGEIVEHARFGYRGVIADVDPSYSGGNPLHLHSPRRHQPWYRILISDTELVSYVGEDRLLYAPPAPTIIHPGCERLFLTYRGGRYVPRRLFH